MIIDVFSTANDPELIHTYRRNKPSDNCMIVCLAQVHTFAPFYLYLVLSLDHWSSLSGSHQLPCTCFILFYPVLSFKSIPNRKTNKRQKHLTYPKKKLIQYRWHGYTKAWHGIIRNRTCEARQSAIGLLLGFYRLPLELLIDTYLAPSELSLTDLW